MLPPYNPRYTHQKYTAQFPGNNEEYMESITKEKNYKLLLKRLLMVGAIIIAGSLITQVFINVGLLQGIALTGLSLVALTLMYALLNSIFKQDHHTKMWNEHATLKNRSYQGYNVPIRHTHYT